MTKLDEKPVNGIGLEPPMMAPADSLPPDPAEDDAPC